MPMAERWSIQSEPDVELSVIEEPDIDLARQKAGR